MNKKYELKIDFFNLSLQQVVTFQVDIVHIILPTFVFFSVHSQLLIKLMSLLSPFLEGRNGRRE